jgi:hypothetical protein
MVRSQERAWRSRDPPVLCLARPCWGHASSSPVMANAEQVTPRLAFDDLRRGRPRSSPSPATRGSEGGRTPLDRPRPLQLISGRGAKPNQEDLLTELGQGRGGQAPDVTDHRLVRIHHVRSKAQRHQPWLDHLTGEEHAVARDHRIAVEAELKLSDATVLPLVSDVVKDHVPTSIRASDAFHESLERRHLSGIGRGGAWLDGERRRRDQSRRGRLGGRAAGDQEASQDHQRHPSLQPLDLHLCHPHRRADGHFRIIDARCAPSLPAEVPCEVLIAPLPSPRGRRRRARGGNQPQPSPKGALACAGCRGPHSREWSEQPEAR